MALRLEQLRKAYVSPDGQAVPVIDIPLFELADAEQVGLIGGSGTGKTTLLNLIAGILAPDSGNVVFDVPRHVGGPRTDAERGFWARNWPFIVTLGTPLLFYYLLRNSDGAESAASVDHAVDPSARMTVELASLNEGDRDVFRGRNIGYVFQTHHLLSGFTALENVLLGMSFTGRSPDPKWARHLLEEVGLGHRLDYKPAKLSVGQQQRVAVARALANRPKLVLADEPTGALDPTTAQQVLDLIRKLCTEVGAALMLVSHDPEISKKLPRVVRLSELNKASTA